MHRLAASRSDRELPGWLRGLVVAGVMTTLVVLEYGCGLRKPRHESKAVRDVRNLMIAAGAGLVMQRVEAPLARRVARGVNRRSWGVAPLLSKRSFPRTAIAVLLLDYGLYVWHVLTHRVPFLWRFHLVHHIDLDLDASTALRFHFGEMLLSVPWRLAQIGIAGASPLALSIWQTLLLASILFHHSNVKLPPRTERWLSFLVMTPRLHGIHHEANRDRADSNWSSGLAIWDLLHRTYLWDVHHGSEHRDAIGVPAYRDPEDVTIGRCFVIPFERQREDWEKPASA